MEESPSTLSCTCGEYLVGVALRPSGLEFRAQSAAKLYEGQLVEDAMSSANRICFGSPRILFKAIKEALEGPSKDSVRLLDGQLLFSCRVRVAGEEVLRDVPIDMELVHESKPEGDDKRQQQKDLLGSLLSQLEELRVANRRMELSIRELQEEKGSLLRRVGHLEDSLGRPYAQTRFTPNPRTKYFGKFKFSAEGRISTSWDGIVSGYLYPLYNSSPIVGRQSVEIEFGSIHDHTYVGVATRELQDGYDCWKEQGSLCLGLEKPCTISLQGKQFKLAASIADGNRLRVKADLHSGVLEW